MNHAGLSLQCSSVADRIRELLTASVATAIGRFRKAAHQRELAALSDRQLRDAGIDLSLAGRGKAVAVSAATLCRLQSLS
ncbi:MAG: DUF1127 domain-containing protein [Hyphomicrobiaceae bacterium]